MNIRKYEKRKTFLILLEYMFSSQSLRFENTNTTTEMVFSFLLKKWLIFSSSYCCGAYVIFDNRH